MTTTTDLQTLAHENALQARSIDYLVHTRNFIEAIKLADEEQRKHIKQLIMDMDTAVISAMVRRLLHDCLESKNIHELRELANDVYGVTKLSKRQLIHLIERKRNEERRTS